MTAKQIFIFIRETDVKGAVSNFSHSATKCMCGWMDNIFYVMQYFFHFSTDFFLTVYYTHILD